MPQHLPPVYPRDLPLEDLRTMETTLVMTLRLFAVRNVPTQTADWRGGLRAAGIQFRAAPAFEALFGIVEIAPRRTLDVRCASCPRLGFDEGRLLQLVSLMQQARHEDAAQILADWVQPAAARMALLPASGLADAMASADLFVPRRHREAAHHGRARSQAGLALVH